jgi:hypothetical protein
MGIGFKEIGYYATTGQRFIFYLINANYQGKKFGKKGWPNIGSIGIQLLKLYL